MVKYTCETCKEEFARKPAYNTHIKKCKAAMMDEADVDENEVINEANEVSSDTIVINDFDNETIEDFITDDIKLYCGDCIEKMSFIEDNSVDLILCDLPYGTTKCKWDTIINLTELWEHYKRIIKKPHGVILLFGQQPFTSMLVSSNYEWFKYNLIWKKIKQLNSYWQIIDL